MAVIYALINSDGDFIYVGASKDPDRRMREHKKTLGFKPPYIILEECGPDWRQPEEFWIAAFREAGVPITNKASGGYGTMAHAESSRRLISAFHKGRKHSAEHCARRGDALRGMPKNWTPEGLEGRKRGEFKPGHSINETLTEEQKQRKIEASRRVARSLTTEERTRRNRLAWASMTPEQKAERGRKIAEGQRRGRVGEANRTPERRAENGRKSREFWASITPERKAEIARKREAARQATLARRRANLKGPTR